ncbi:(deoxy)nucleoside triphosphate pyrophosphohydrolase [Ruicaihuangia caeni]|uniref:8-oxo-dGTP diphosphatase n=1 Tax=Ruicaihuangia caeni TaxID=3042517 RepID=A0AAW6TB32_9MICO|nr:(deoxy)nucleoside triphosphate pyrophosphohydrolase [Klugiella sp. YN-L-19]MDI2098297.1 (deoxy)nucleoside triphosphate pyrophosphohydrolase [Klugiella sp. YN-L-19]
MLHVVAAVFADADGRLLACRRAAHKPDAGKWEFPGGKVEAGEDPRAALQREIAEELGVSIEVGPLIDRSVTEVGPGRRPIDLACYAVVTDGALPAQSTDHDRMLWLPTSELRTLDWAAPDMPAVARLADRG